MPRNIPALAGQDLDQGKATGSRSAEIVTPAPTYAVGWQCPECSGVRIDLFESRFGGKSEDRFECRECGCTWHRGG